MVRPGLPVPCHCGLPFQVAPGDRRFLPSLVVGAGTGWVATKTQRWAPEELLRTLVEAEICARDASNARHRLKAAAFL